MPKVLKPFMTPSRVFTSGDEVGALDGPVTLAHWQDQGFVERDPAPTAAPATPTAASAPELAPGA